MRILLINPPYPVCESLTMPLGLLYLGARLEKAGDQVFLEDIQLCRSPVSQIKQTLKTIRPQVVGITSFSINLPIASKILQTVKRLNPDAVTVWGGPMFPLMTRISSIIIPGLMWLSGGRGRKLWWRSWID